MKEKKAKENQGDDRHQFFRLHALVVLEWMKEKKAKENQGNDRHQFSRLHAPIVPELILFSAYLSAMCVNGDAVTDSGVKIMLPNGIVMALQIGRWYAATDAQRSGLYMSLIP